MWRLDISLCGIFQYDCKLSEREIKIKKTRCAENIRNFS